MAIPIFTLEFCKCNFELDIRHWYLGLAILAIEFCHRNFVIATFTLQFCHWNTIIAMSACNFVTGIFWLQSCNLSLKFCYCNFVCLWNFVTVILLQHFCLQKSWIFSLEPCHRNFATWIISLEFWHCNSLCQKSVTSFLVYLSFIQPDKKAYSENSF